MANPDNNTQAVEHRIREKLANLTAVYATAANDISDEKDAIRRAHAPQRTEHVERHRKALSRYPRTAYWQFRARE